MEDLLQNPPVLLMLIGCTLVILLTWTLDGIGRPGNAEAAEAPRRPAPAVVRRLPAPAFDTPERCECPIGRYMDSTIFETVAIGGVEYRFDHVLGPGARWQSELGERCIAPGLVYLTR